MAPVESGIGVFGRLAEICPHIWRYPELWAAIHDKRSPDWDLAVGDILRSIVSTASVQVDAEHTMDALLKARQIPAARALLTHPALISELSTQKQILLNAQFQIRAKQIWRDAQAKIFTLRQRAERLQRASISQIPLNNVSEFEALMRGETDQSLHPKLVEDYLISLEQTIVDGEEVWLNQLKSHLSSSLRDRPDKDKETPQYHALTRAFEERDLELAAWLLERPDSHQSPERDMDCFEEIPAWPFYADFTEVLGWIFQRGMAPLSFGAMRPPQNDATAQAMLGVLDRLVKDPRSTNVEHITRLGTLITTFLLGNELPSSQPVLVEVQTGFFILNLPLVSCWLPALAVDGMIKVIIPDPAAAPTQIPEGLEFPLLFDPWDVMQSKPGVGLILHPVFLLRLMALKRGRYAAFLSELGRQLPLAYVLPEKPPADCPLPNATVFQDLDAIARRCLCGDSSVPLQLVDFGNCQRLVQCFLQMHQFPEQSPDMVDQLIFYSGRHLGLLRELLVSLLRGYPRKATGRPRFTKADVVSAWEDPHFRTRAREVLLAPFRDQHDLRWIDILLEHLTMEMLTAGDFWSFVPQCQWEQYFHAEDETSLVEGPALLGRMEEVGLVTLNPTSPQSIRLPSSGIGFILLDFYGAVA